MIILFALALALAFPTATAPCRPHETGVVVEVAAHALTLCDEGRTAARHRVALGSGGVGKRQRGDDRTPLGLYSLGAPRASQHFGTFVPVGYPTGSQRRMGFTGDSVGIHGPPRGIAGALGTAIDWTAGCIAVGSDAEIESIAAFIRRRQARTVRIE
jgi:murein L,D-transpeptidase YafK